MFTRVLLLALLMVASGCGTGGVRAELMPPGGGPVLHAPSRSVATMGLFVNSRAPLTTDFDETRVGSKHGEATVTFVQEPLLTQITLAWGDASIRQAAEEGDISTVHFADYEVLSVLGIFIRFTTHVYGD